MKDTFENIRPEVIKHLVNSFNTKGFIEDVLFSCGIQNSCYQNAKGMFAWNKSYSEVEKMEQIFDDIIVFSANINAWDFPLVYDSKAQVVFMLMSEDNLNQKRKQNYLDEYTPHYSKILCEINQPYSNQLPFIKIESKNPISIINKFTSDTRIEQISPNSKLIILCSQKYHEELLKVTAAMFDKNLMLIDEEVDWSSYIDTDYNSYNIIDSKIENQINEANANTLIFNSMKEDLVSLKQQKKCEDTISER